MRRAVFGRIADCVVLFLSSLLVVPACSFFAPTLDEYARARGEGGASGLGAGGTSEPSGGSDSAGSDSAGASSAAGTGAGGTGSAGTGSGGTTAMAGGTTGSGAAGMIGESGAPTSAGQGGGGCGGDCSKAPLVHRYSFDGTGVDVLDSVGGAPGKVVNAVLNGDGTLTLAGGTSDEYVNLPNGIISSLTDATFEAWFVWGGGKPWQRLFDFGSSSAGEDKQGSGVTYLFFTLSTDTAYPRAAYSTNGNSNEIVVQMLSSLASGQSTQVDVVADDTNNLMSLYVDGMFEASVAFEGHLTLLHDVNNWLGRSQFVDPSFGGTLDEFRIYAGALTAAQIASNHNSGANSL